MFLQAKADSALALGLYLHVPFCAHTCDFCGFYQQAPQRAGIETYLAAIETELRLRPPPRPVETLFFGGGTPGLLLAKDLQRLGRAIQPFLAPGPREWTVEMAPSTVKADKVEALLEMGVTRISMGVQSFQPHFLAELGRQHSHEQIHRAIHTLRAGGLQNLNLDLIFAIPGQSLSDWEADLLAAVACAPEHLSTYCLTFEEDTALWLRLQRGQVKKRTEDEEAAYFETSWRVLGEHGYEQYEISNYARPGFACRHNIDTWRMQEWIGYGPSAASQVGGERYTNSPDLTAWASALDVGKPARIEVTPVDDAILATDALIFGLRMNAGMDPRALRRRFPEAPWDLFAALVADLADNGLIAATPESWALTAAGRLVADGIGSHFLEATI